MIQNGNGQYMYLKSKTTTHELHWHRLTLR